MPDLRSIFMERYEMKKLFPLVGQTAIAAMALSLAPPSLSTDQQAPTRCEISGDNLLIAYSRAKQNGFEFRCFSKGRKSRRNGKVRVRGEQKVIHCSGTTSRGDEQRFNATFFSGKPLNGGWRYDVSAPNPDGSGYRLSSRPSIRKSLSDTGLSVTSRTIQQTGTQYQISLSALYLMKENGNCAKVISEAF